MSSVASTRTEASAESFPEVATSDRRPLRVVSTVLFGWSVLYALPHLYWGLGGEAGFSVLKRSATETGVWEAANVFAFVLIVLAGLLGLALQRFCEPLPRLLLLAVVSLGCAVAAAHGVYGIVYRAAQASGVTSLDGEVFRVREHSWVLWDMLAIEPWFLVEGLLLGTTGYLAQDASDGRQLWLQVTVCGTLFAITTGVAGLRFA